MLITNLETFTNVAKYGSMWVNDTRNSHVEMHATRNNLTTKKSHVIMAKKDDNNVSIDRFTL
jgi:hypothetical protein